MKGIGWGAVGREARRPIPLGGAMGNREGSWGFLFAVGSICAAIVAIVMGVWG